MRKTKYLIAQFTFYDRTGIQSLLEKQARKGWMLTKISAFGWKFCRVEPRNIHFAVTYFPKASAFDPEPSEKQKHFQEFCEYAGWKLAGSSAQMQIFYNEGEDPIPIETDPQIEMENIEASAKKSYLPAYYLLLANAVLQMGLLLWRMKDDFTGVLSSNANLFTALCWVCIWIMCGMELLGYYTWRKKARQAIETDGSFVPTQGFRTAELVMLWIIMAGFLLLLISLGGKNAALMAVIVVVLFLMVLLVQGITALMKKLGFSAKNNRNLTIIATVILSLLFGFGGVFLIIKGTVQWFPEEEKRYEYQGHSFVTYDDTLPLNVEDLTEVEGVEYSRYFRGNASLLLEKYVANQQSHVGSYGPDLYYVIYEIKLPLLYDPVLNALLHENDGWYGFNGEPINYRKSNSDLWQAKKTYRKFAGDEAENEYLICYEDRIIFIRLENEPTPQQMEIIANKLAK